MEMMSESAFWGQVQQTLRRVEPKLIAAAPVENEAYAEAYRFVEQYALERRLVNTMVALIAMRGRMTCGHMERESRTHEQSTHIGYFVHCLAVTQMLIDLHISLSHREEDVLLASSLCHILFETIRCESLEQELSGRYGLDPLVYDTVKRIVREDDQSGAEQKRFFEAIREHKLALLIKLADRGVLVEQLYGFSSWSARNYIYETRNFFFPMCIYAKEHYPELLGVVSVLMEKIRNLTELAEILLARYESRENELTQQILALQEENATLRSLICSLQEIN